MNYCHGLRHQGIRVWLPKPPSSSQYSSVELYVFLTLMRHWDDGTSRRLLGRWWGAGGCQFDSYRCCSRSPDSRRWGLSVQINYLQCHYHLPCFVYILDMPLSHLYINNEANIRYILFLSDRSRQTTHAKWHIYIKPNIPTRVPLAMYTKYAFNRTGLVIPCNPA